MKILNLFAGIGGNRKYWKGDITAIEFNEKYADVYKILYPQDIVVITDAWEYCMQYYDEYDFIWASPPCQTHSKLNYPLHSQRIRRMPDMKLWGLISYLKTFAKQQKWIVENVKPYYESLIPQSFILGRHYYWSNFPVLKNSYQLTSFNSICGNFVSNLIKIQVHKW